MPPGEPLLTETREGTSQRCQCLSAEDHVLHRAYANQ